jgi:hypothetical protein
MGLRGIEAIDEIDEIEWFDEMDAGLRGLILEISDYNTW